MSNHGSVETKDMIGKKYGSLTVLSEYKDPNLKDRSTLLLCKCDCGNDHAILHKYEILNGYATDCRHCNSYKYKGKIYGDFEVIEKNEAASIEQRRILWTCRCMHCGYTQIFQSRDLNNYERGKNPLKCPVCKAVNRRNNLIKIMMDRKYFGYLEVLEYDKENSTSGRDRYICRCICGKIIPAVSGNHLRVGAQISCGCTKNMKDKSNRNTPEFEKIRIDREDLNKEAEIKYIDSNDLSYINKNAYYYDAETLEKLEIDIYLRKIYISMIDRTNNENCADFVRYGAIGRNVSSEWLNSYETFYNDVYDLFMLARKMYPNQRLNMDRINNNLGYSKDNIRFVPNIVNSNNTNTNTIVEYQGQYWNLSMLTSVYGSEYNINVSDLSRRLNSDWSIEDALFTPKGTVGNKETKPRKVISPIYYIEDVERKHKLSQGLNEDDIDYTYAPPNINISDCTREDLVELNKELHPDGLFGYLKEIGKLSKYTNEEGNEMYNVVDDNDFINKKFGKLTIISRNEELTNKRNHIMYNCYCDCGNTNVIMSKLELVSGKRTDCGKCAAYQYKGMIIGDFTVIDRNPKLEKIKKQSTWDCKCNKCGYMRAYTSSELNRAIKNGGNLKCAKCKNLNHRNEVIRQMLNKQFGDLAVISYDQEGSLKNERDTYICRCSCGNIKSILGYNLRSGTAQSCGCKGFKFKNDSNHMKEDFNESEIVTEVTDINSISKFGKSDLYALSQNEDSDEYKDKLYYVTLKNYKYGLARTGVLPKEWESIDTFYNDTIDTYKATEAMYPGIQLYIDKIDETKPYSKTNFKFTPTCPNLNKSFNNQNIEYQGQYWSASMLSKVYGEVNGLYSSDIQVRLNLGWTVDEALYTPKGSTKGQYDKPISPIYYTDDVKRNHKIAQGLNENDIDYTYKPETLNTTDVQQIIEYNHQAQINNSTTSTGLFSHLKELGKDNK